MIGVDLFELLYQVQTHLSEVPLTLNCIRTVNVDVVNVGCHLVRIANRASTARATGPAEGGTRPTIWALSTSGSCSA